MCVCEGGVWGCMCVKVYMCDVWVSELVCVCVCVCACVCPMASPP